MSLVVLGRRHNKDADSSVILVQKGSSVQIVFIFKIKLLQVTVCQRILKCELFFLLLSFHKKIRNS